MDPIRTHWEEERAREKLGSSPGIRVAQWRSRRAKISRITFLQKKGKKITDFAKFHATPLSTQGCFREFFPPDRGHLDEAQFVTALDELFRGRSP